MRRVALMRQVVGTELQLVCVEPELVGLKLQTKVPQTLQSLRSQLE
jgi:hypothetical protein